MLNLIFLFFIFKQIKQLKDSLFDCQIKYYLLKNVSIDNCDKLRHELRIEYDQIFNDLFDELSKYTFNENSTSTPTKQQGNMILNNKATSTSSNGSSSIEDDLFESINGKHTQ
jgi:hypothetical protein